MEASRDELLCSQLLPLWNEISVWAGLGEHHDYRVPDKLSIITNSYFHCCCAPVQNRSLSPTWETNFMTCDSTRTWTWPLTPLITEGGLYLYFYFFCAGAVAQSMYAWDSSSRAHRGPGYSHSEGVKYTPGTRRFALTNFASNQERTAWNIWIANGRHVGDVHE